MQDLIVIDGLKVETVIGCFDWERQIRQPLLLDLKIYTDLSNACASDMLADTLNYAEICDISSSTIIQSQPELIEHAAHLVIQALFNQFVSIEKINIIIRKPAIIPAAQSVGIQIERHRDYFRHRNSE
ncbi:dihydroneopterin aldolase [Acinetobacter qingfengensis]|uniref:7,8-dihydroneopterin aldolase n=1 Tax=Acinetobacter qingfengensis TaxID=1262585 RepID=A0A1E7RF19_9GAMM|nr:dihydroneopterin aldolase [Acinetobacter qingfengensis]KAA8735661.1 dihydroneopterin aldolase [Acinetobacter qingfengensis]OEY97893.1 dihydroneopterin aldolase [Acinetobacter qingfengensis]